MIRICQIENDVFFYFLQFITAVIIYLSVKININFYTGRHLKTKYVSVFEHLW